MSRLLGTSATEEGIGTVIAAFYGGERKTLRPSVSAAPRWTVHQPGGAEITSVEVVVSRGRFRFQTR